MGMRRLFVTPDQLATAQEGLVRLDPEQAHYLGLVLRLREGDALELFDGRGARIAATLVDAAGQTALRLGERAHDPEAAGALILAQALSKGEKLDLIVQKATELGAARIIPFAAERSVVKLDEERGAARATRLRRIAQEAARQCGRASVPEVDEPASWEGLFALLRAEPWLRCVLLDTDPAAPQLSRLSLVEAPRLLLAVGPEGGFSPRERERALAAGFLAASLGPLILRTETAGLAALSIVQHLRGALG